MSKDRELSVEEAQQVLQKAEQEKREKFSNELQALLEKHGYDLTARFEMFGTSVNPPIRIIRRQE